MAVLSAPLAESRRTSRECTTETCEQVLSVSLAERPPDELVDGRDVARSAHASIPASASRDVFSCVLNRVAAVFTVPLASREMQCSHPHSPVFAHQGAQPARPVRRVHGVAQEDLGSQPGL